MSKYRGMALIFGTCADHTAENVKIVKKVFNSTSMAVIAKAEHVHCYECGCYKCRSSSCPFVDFEVKPMPLRPVDSESELYNYEKVENTRPDRVGFSISWEHDGEKFNVNGFLPTLLATKVLDVVNRPSL